MTMLRLVSDGVTQVPPNLRTCRDLLEAAWKLVMNELTS